MADPRDDFHDLPILAELGADLRRAAGQSDERERPARSRHASDKHLARRRSQRLTRRPALVAAAVLILAGLPIALTAGLSSESLDRVSGQGAGQATTAAGVDELLASGTGPEEAWVLSAQGNGCLVLELAGQSLATTDCSGSERDSAAARGALQAEAARPAADIAVVNGSRDGFVFGTVPDTTARVRVTVGDRAPITVPARAMNPQGTETGVKAFVAAVDERVPPRTPVIMLGTDRRGKVTARYRIARSP